MNNEQAIASAREKYVGDEVAFKFATDRLSYSDMDNQIRLYKQPAEPSLSKADLRVIVDIMLMGIHWQGYRIDSKGVVRAICAQHEDSPNPDNIHRKSHPVGIAHRRIMSLFVQNKEVNHVRYPQDLAARGLGGHHTVSTSCEGAASASEHAPSEH